MEALGISPVHIVLFIVPFIAGLGFLSYQAWERNRRKRIERINQLVAEEADRKIHETARIPEWGSFIRHDGERQTKHLHLPPSLLPAGFGSYGMSQLLRFLIELDRLELHPLVGACLVVEADKILRDRFLTELPAVYRDRVVLAKVEQYSGGFSNREVEDIKQYIAKWGPEVERAATQAAQLFLRRTDRNNEPSIPSEIPTFIGLGGHGYPGVVGVHTLHEAYPEVHITACTDLPVDEPLRDNFLKLKSPYEQAGVHDWFTTDSLGHDRVSNDTAMVNTLTGLCTAAIQADSKPRLDNVFTRVNGTKPGGVCSIQYVYHPAVAYTFKPCTCRPARFYLNTQLTIHEVLSILETLEIGQGTFAVDMPMGHERRSTYDLILAPLNTEDLLAVTDHVAKARALAAQHQNPKQPRSTLFGKENYHTLLASWPSTVDPVEPFAQLAGIRLQSLTHTPTMVPELVRAPAKRTLPSPRPRRVAVTLSHTNGKEELAPHDA